jgi:undecaprenyl pyrophosphate synthase
MIKFVDCYWPEFTVWRFIAVLLDYQVSLFRQDIIKDD